MSTKVPYTEAETRQQRIDASLRLAEWNVSDPSQVIQKPDIYVKNSGILAAVTDRPYAGYRFANYALLCMDTTTANAMRKSNDAVLKKVRILSRNAVASSPRKVGKERTQNVAEHITYVAPFRILPGDIYRG